LIHFYKRVKVVDPLDVEQAWISILSHVVIKLFKLGRLDGIVKVLAKPSSRHKAQSL